MVLILDFMKKILQIVLFTILCMETENLNLVYLEQNEVQA